MGVSGFLLPTSFHPNLNSLGGGGEGVIGFVGILMEVGSLIFIIRFEMQLLLLSLERAFGKLRFLKGWHFLCGQQLMVKF